jgi:hypothetical protein
MELTGIVESYAPALKEKVMVGNERAAPILSRV